MAKRSRSKHVGKGAASVAATPGPALSEAAPALAPAPASCRRRLISAVAVALLLAGLLGMLNDASRSYPYYFTWDMDLVCAIDTMLMNSGYPPDTIHHTGFGMHLVFKYAAALGGKAGLVSAVRLDELLHSLNPWACMAELTTFLRRLSPWATTAAVLCLWAAVCKLFRLGPVAAVFAFLLLGTQEAALYLATMIRSSQYAILCWSGAMLAMALAARAVGQRKRLAWLAVGGALLSLAYMTKLQAMILIALGPVAFFFGMRPADDDGPDGRQRTFTRRQSILTAALSVANLLAFALLVALGSGVRIPEGIPMWHAKFGMTAHAWLMFAVLAGLCAVQLHHLLRNRAGSAAFVACGYLTLMLAGFIGAYGLHLLMFPGRALGFEYMLWDFKVLFLRQATEHTEFKGLAHQLGVLWQFMYYYTTLFVVHVVALALLGVWAFRRKGDAAARRAFWFCVALSGLALVSITLATRFNHKDLVWVEPVLVFLTVGYCAMLPARGTALRLPRLAASSLLVLALLMANGSHLSRARQRIDALYNEYGWHSLRWLRHVFPGNQPRYFQVMYEHYGPHRKVPFASVRAAGRQAAQFDQAKRLASYVFASCEVSSRGIGLARQGLPVWLADIDSRIDKLPDELTDAVIVDPAAVTGTSSPLLPSEQERTKTWALDRFRRPDAAAIAVLPRADIDVYVFVEDVDYAELTRMMAQRALASKLKRPPPVSAPIVVTKGGVKASFRGVRVPAYTVLPVASLKGRCFFLIRPPRVI